MVTTFLDGLPLWALYLLLVAIGMIVIKAGSYAGRHWTARSQAQKKEGIDSLVGSVLALLAFLLVFMTGIATNRHDTRRQLVIAEANAIGTTYLRAGYLDEQQRSEVRTLLREYVDVRLAAIASPTLFDQSRTRSEEIHAELWEHTETLARAAPESTTTALFVVAVNSVIDLHTERVRAVFNRIPRSNWLAIFVMALLSLAAVGFNDGLNDGRSDGRGTIGETALLLVFAALLLLIVDLDRSGEGLLQVSQQALIDLQQQMQSSRP